MQDTQMMAVHVEQTARAFRVNGVTLAKRHLIKTLGKDQPDLDKVLAKYLVIVPFLATGFEIPKEASESVKYGAIKAKRIFDAIGLDEDSIVPFMLVFLAQTGEGDSPNEAIDGISHNLRQAGFYGKPASFQEDARSKK